MDEELYSEEGRFRGKQGSLGSGCLNQSKYPYGSWGPSCLWDSGTHPRQAARGGS